MLFRSVSQSRYPSLLRCFRITSFMPFDAAFIKAFIFTRSVTPSNSDTPACIPWYIQSFSSCFCLMSSSPVVLKSSLATWSAAVVAFILPVFALYHAIARFSPIAFACSSVSFILAIVCLGR